MDTTHRLTGGIALNQVFLMHGALYKPQTAAAAHSTGNRRLGRAPPAAGQSLSLPGRYDLRALPREDFADRSHRDGRPALSLVLRACVPALQALENGRMPVCAVRSRGRMKPKGDAIMKTIETVITVLPDGSIQIPRRPDLTPGNHRAVLVVDEPVPSTAGTPLKLKMLNLAAWPPDSTYRREDLYDDTGR